MMQKLFLKTVVLFVAISSQAQIAKVALPQYVEGTCIVDSNDPFEPNVKMNEGPLKGMCINPLARRSVKILNAEEAEAYFSFKTAESLKNGDVVIANFSHQQKFWIAKIPMKQVQTLKIQIQYFPILKFPKIDVAHTQFLFEFKEGAEIPLTPQERILKNSEIVKLKKLIFTVENIGPYGDVFDAAKGLKGHYKLAYRAVSLADKYQWMVTQQQHVVEQKRLNLRADQVRAVLNEALNRADQWSTNRNYHTIKPNCVSELFSILDKVLGIKGLPLPFVPNFAPQALWLRGILDTQTILPNLNESYDGKP